MDNPKEVWISDTCIIIDLFNAGILNHLFSLDYSIKTTDFVIREVFSIDKEHLSEFDVVKTSAEEMEELIKIRTLQPGLSITDISVYYHAKKEGFVLITGDNLLRKTAQRNGVNVHGLLWITMDS